MGSDLQNLAALAGVSAHSCGVSRGVVCLVDVPTGVTNAWDQGSASVRRPAGDGPDLHPLFALGPGASGDSASLPGGRNARPGPFRSGAASRVADCRFLRAGAGPLG